MSLWVEHGKAGGTASERDWPQKNLVQVLAGCKNNSRETPQGNACRGDVAPENGEIQGQDVSACPSLWRTRLGMGGISPSSSSLSLAVHLCVPHLS